MQNYGRYLLCDLEGVVFISTAGSETCRRGEEPEQDAAEKLLLRTARRGVVRLFNAVANAQKQHAEDAAVGGRAKVGASSWLLQVGGYMRAGGPV